MGAAEPLPIESTIKAIRRKSSSEGCESVGRAGHHLPAGLHAQPLARLAGEHLPHPDSEEKHGFHCALSELLNPRAYRAAREEPLMF